MKGMREGKRKKIRQTKKNKRFSRRDDAPFPSPSFCFFDLFLFSSFVSSLFLHRKHTRAQAAAAAAAVDFFSKQKGQPTTTTTNLGSHLGKRKKKSLFSNAFLFVLNLFSSLLFFFLKGTHRRPPLPCAARRLLLSLPRFQNSFPLRGFGAGVCEKGHGSSCALGGGDVNTLSPINYLSNTKSF